MEPSSAIFISCAAIAVLVSALSVSGGWSAKKSILTLTCLSLSASLFLNAYLWHTAVSECKTRWEATYQPEFHEGICTVLNKTGARVHEEDARDER